jgi:transcriptional regulator with XRE-family HTH domain
VPTPLAKVIGANVHQARIERHLTQQDVATAAKEYGLTWGRSSVSVIESGDYVLSAAEFLLLPHIFAKAAPSAAHLDASSFLEPSEGVTRVELTPGAEVEANVLGSLVTWSRHTRVRPPVVLSEFDTLAAAWILPGESKWDATFALWPEAHPSDVAKAAASIGEPERAVAKAIGVGPADVAVAARRRWGHGFRDERDRRVHAMALERGEHMSTRSLQTLRGHVTRALTAEIEQFIKEVHSGQR